MGFSVLMSVYEKEKPEYLMAALESLQNQTLQADEIILIEDGPLTEKLEYIIEQFGKCCNCLRTYQFPENVQLGRALQKGVELCSNELVARMDTDDIAEPDRFRMQYEYMTQHPNVSVLGGWMEEFNDQGTYTRVKQMPEENERIRTYGKYRNPVNHMTVMFRKTDVLEAGNYRHFPYLEDYDLWSRMMAQNMEFHNLPATLVKMRNNNNVYERRGGIAYFRRYAVLRKQQRQEGLLSGREYAAALLLTFGMTLQPVFLRRLVYQRILRK
jgi:glycosyltransferase involved in cell wall biosynthesis